MLIRSRATLKLSLRMVRNCFAGLVQEVTKSTNQQKKKIFKNM